MEVRSRGTPAGRRPGTGLVGWTAFCFFHSLPFSNGRREREVFGGRRHANEPTVPQLAGWMTTVLGWLGWSGEEQHRITTHATQRFTAPRRKRKGTRARKNFFASSPKHARGRLKAAVAVVVLPAHFLVLDLPDHHLSPAPRAHQHVIRRRVRPHPSHDLYCCYWELSISDFHAPAHHSQVQRIDSQLDRLPLSAALPAAAAAAATGTGAPEDGITHANQARITHLQNLIKSLSTSASSQKKALLSRNRIRDVLQQARIADDCSTCQQHFVVNKQAGIARVEGDRDQEYEEEQRRYSVTDVVEPSYEHELEWLLLSKATAHTYGLVLNAILEQTLPLSDDIWYWDDVLGSARHASVYSVQTSPLRLYAWGKGVYQDVRRRGGDLARDGWGQFYGLVQEVVRERSIVQIQRRVLSPLALVRNEARAKQSALKRIRLINANALGVLLGEGLSNQSSHDEGFRTPTAQSEDSRHRWKSAVTRSIALMDIVLQEVTDPHVPVDEFDDAVAARTDQDRYYQILEASDYSALSLNPTMVAERLSAILDVHLNGYSKEFRERTKEHGRPSGIVRYWLPATVLLVSLNAQKRPFDRANQTSGLIYYHLPDCHGSPH